MPEQPDSHSLVADAQRIAALLHAVETPAPETVHARIAELAATHRGRRRRRRAPVFAFAGAFVAAVVVVVVLAVDTTTSPPTALRVSQLALARWTAPAPRSLMATGTSIAFPRWSARGWPSRGARRDQIGGRAVTTEFYSSYPSGTLGYSIVSGPPLRWGGSGPTVTRSGTRYLLLRTSRVQIIAWVEDDHTCVLASRSASVARLLALAVDQTRGAPANSA
jgi:hypothetical protein